MTIGSLRHLNPDLWRDLELEALGGDSARLTMVTGDEWAIKLRNIMSNIHTSQIGSGSEDRESGSVTDQREQPATGILASMKGGWTLLNSKLTSLMIDPYGTIMGKSSVDIASFPVIWLAFPDILSACRLFTQTPEFESKLRNFSNVVFPRSANWIWGDMEFKNINLSGCELNQHIFTRCNLRKVNFSGAVLKSCQFVSCSLPEEMPAVIATIESTTITDCPDAVSLACAKSFFHQQLRHMPPGDDRNRLELAYARCLATSGDQRMAHNKLSELPITRELFAEYVQALLESGFTAGLDQLADDPAVLQLIQPETYWEYPSLTLLNAETLYIILLRESLFDSHQELRRALWNMQMTCSVGYTPYQGEKMLDDDTVHSSIRLLGLNTREQVPTKSERQYQVHLLRFMNEKSMKAVWVDQNENCFYSAISYHFMPPTSRLNVEWLWMKQLLAYLFYDFLQQNCMEKTFKPSRFPCTKHSAINSEILTLKPLTSEQCQWVQEQLLREVTSAEDIYEDLLGNNIWGATDFVPLAAIMLRRPIYLYHPYFSSEDLKAKTLATSVVGIQGKGDEMQLHSSGAGQPHPLLLIYSGHGHWLTAFLPEN